jgi:hypothetical protein
LDVTKPLPSRNVPLPDRERERIQAIIEKHVARCKEAGTWQM